MKNYSETYNKGIQLIEGSPVFKLAALIIIFAGINYAKAIIAPTILALFISIVSIPPISWLAKKRIPRWMAILVVILLLILLFSGFASLVGGTMAFFLRNVTKYESTIITITNSVIQFLNDKGLNIPEDQMSKLIEPARIQTFTTAAAKGLFTMLGNAFLIFLIMLFILMEFSSFYIKAKAITNGTYKSILYISTILKNIRHYLAIKTLICIATGIFIYISLLIIGVDYPLLWALLAGLMNYIPNIGSIFATIPAFFFAMVQLGLGGALWTLAVFVVIHNVLGNFLEPKLMGKGLDLSALVVILSLLFWGFLLGPVGMFLATPFTLTIKIIMEQSEKTRWIAILLGTPAEAKTYLQNKELLNEQNKN